MFLVPLNHQLTQMTPSPLLMEEVKKIGDFSLSETALCYTLSAKNGSYICLNLTTNIGHNMDSFSPVNWLKKAYTVPFVIILVVAIWYFPFILCLFTPTEMKKAGRVMIVLDGTSPLGISSCIIYWVHISLLMSTPSNGGIHFYFLSYLP